ncbi:adenine deaminase [Planctomycetes bacterium CA13]
MEFKVRGNLVDVHQGEIFAAEVSVADGRITAIDQLDHAVENYLLPGFVDSHIHVESSMLLPGQFARVAVTHGTVATVSDPHEIANVCGIEGIELMLRNAAQSKFKFCFGAPACVPATPFETAGGRLDADAVAKLLADDRIGYLSEMMDFPGVLNRSTEVMKKIAAAAHNGKPVDGHAPGLRGDEAAAYFAAGITTDHECFTREEAEDKLAAGCKIAIREGSAARNFDALHSLIDDYPDACMLCSDDKHPDEFLEGHINRLVVRAVANGLDRMNVLRVACVNPVEHYHLDVGLLRVGDQADFIVTEDLTEFHILKTYLDGVLVADQGKSLLAVPPAETVNNFTATPIQPSQLQVAASGTTIRVMQAIGGQLFTNQIQRPCRVQDGNVVADVARDILKIVVVNRYKDASPAVAFASGFGLKSGAFASSVAHDSHNIVAIGTNDEDLSAAINAVINEQGGLSISADGQTDVLPLPVAGLMSTDSCESVGKAYSKMDQRLKTELGSSLRAPYMTLSFMALLVIPSLKLSDKGLFDSDKFEFVPLFVEEKPAK